MKDKNVVLSEGTLYMVDLDYKLIGSEILVRNDNMGSDIMVTVSKDYGLNELFRPMINKVMKNFK